MEYTNVCQGWIYCITNKINGKKYIGQTTQYNSRKYHHFHYERCYRLSQAIKKYGKENFTMEPILTFKAIDKDVCLDVLNKLEIFYIKKYDTFNRGYNSTAGGAGRLSCIPTEETRKKISKKTREYAEKHPTFYSDIATKNPILQYDLNGKFIKEYSSETEAAKEFPNQRSAMLLISEHLHGKHESAQGYMWRYKESDDYPLYIEPYKVMPLMPVYYYSIDGVLLESYNSVREASEITGVNQKTIKTSIRSSKLGRNRKGNYWSREAPIS